VLRLVKNSTPLAWRKKAKVVRARIFESIGVHRYSQPALYGLDRTMAALLPAKGVFLEVGANDGYAQSNTYYLEVVRGWSGILIEPLPSLYARCVRLRRRSTCFNAACVSTERAGGLVTMVDRDLMSVTLGQQPKSEEERRLLGRQRTVQVATATISSLIDRAGYQRVDFMSIDVEGAEISLLGGLDFERHTPSWALIETAHPVEVAAACAPWLVLERQLSHHDYLFRASSGSST
jgi:FkbM family methyltransferase